MVDSGLSVEQEAGDSTAAGGGTCEDDGVEAGFAPQLHEVNHVPEAQGRVAGEHHARLAEVAAEVAVDAGVVLQLVGLDQLTGDNNNSKVCREGNCYLVARLLKPQMIWI